MQAQASIPVNSRAKAILPEMVGEDKKVPILNGSLVPYINLDNAASTPAFRYVKEKVNQALDWYSSVHRGSGFKSLLSTHLYEQCRQIVSEFIEADEEDTIIFCPNTSVAVNQLVNCLDLDADDVILTTMMEHHSNDLPWRSHGKVVYVGLKPDGSLDLQKFEQCLEENSGRVKLVAVSGASNVTGFINPIYTLAEISHRHGANIFVDCAQLAPHRKITKGKIGSLRNLDFIALSAHKMYAPFGSGALVGPKKLFRQHPPDYSGGGTIQIVTLDEVYWAEPPERNEVGSPNVLGAVALAASMQNLANLGMEAIVKHEATLTQYLLKKLQIFKSVQVYGSSDPNLLDDRLGVVSFQVEGIPHAKVAAILSYEGGIAVRDGCFCAHPYVINLLGINQDEFQFYKQRALNQDRSLLPGLVRVSFGCYNTIEDIDRFIEVLERIVVGSYLGEYVVDRVSGSYSPRDFDTKIFSKFFTL